jgi:hypothetical protein
LFSFHLPPFTSLGHPFKFYVSFHVIGVSMMLPSMKSIGKPKEENHLKYQFKYHFTMHFWDGRTIQFIMYISLCVISIEKDDLVCHLYFEILVYKLYIFSLVALNQVVKHQLGCNDPLKAPTSYVVHYKLLRVQGLHTFIEKVGHCLKDIGAWRILKCLMLMFLMCPKKC